MSLEHAILGFLNYGPSTGYDLKKVFDQSVNHFWPADRSQIYRTLSRLSDDGLATVEVVHQEDAPDRKVYYITDKGKEELRTWLTDSSAADCVRSVELVRVFFAGQLSQEQALEMFRRGLRWYRETLAAYYAMRDKSLRALSAGEDGEVSVRDAFFWQLTLENGVAATEALVAWLESVIGRLEREDYTVFPDYSCAPTSDSTDYGTFPEDRV